MWIEPKINWKPTDYYNIEDWKRVRSNLEHVWSWMILNRLPNQFLLETDTGRGRDELPYVHLVNNMEKNLAYLQNVFGVTFTENVAQKTWYSRLDALYTVNPDYTDWNRWEIILKRVYESIQYIDTYIFAPISGTCYSGADRTLIRFSRGR